TWVSDPVRAAQLREARAGSVPAPEPEDRVGALGERRKAQGDGGNFADDLIHALVSLWRPVHGSSSAAVNADPRLARAPLQSATPEATAAEQSPDSVATPIEPEAAPAEIPVEGTPTAVAPTVQPT